MTRACATIGKAALWVVTALATGCGGPEVVAVAPPERVLDRHIVKEADAFGDFRGEHVAASTPFRLAQKPIGVDGPNLVVSLVKTEWSSITTPTGKEVKEATASLRVQKGQEERSVVISQGEDRVVFGARLFVVGAGEAYDPQRMVYQAWVDLRVDAEPEAAP